MPVNRRETQAGKYVNKQGLNDLTPPMASLTARARVRAIAKAVDPTVILSKKLEDTLIQYADYFVETTMLTARALARVCNSPQDEESRDVELQQLEHRWNMLIPPCDSEELQSHTNASAKAHKEHDAHVR